MKLVGAGATFLLMIKLCKSLTKVSNSVSDIFIQTDSFKNKDKEANLYLDNKVW